MASQARQQLSLQTPSPLLDLPGELRNWIFEYVLTSPTPLYYQPRQNKLLDTTENMLKSATLVERLDFMTPLREFNQLKYVNKQLYVETAGWEMRLNTVTFRTQHHQWEWSKKVESAELAFLNFIAPITGRRISWLTRVTIQTQDTGLRGVGHTLPAPPLLANIAQFCKENTQAKVQYEFCRWTWAPFIFYYFGVMLMVALRNDEEGRKAAHDLISSDYWRPWILEKDCHDWKKSWRILKGVNNLTIWPSCNGQNRCLDKIYFSGLRSGLPRDLNGHDRWYAHQWYTYGICAAE